MIDLVPQPDGRVAIHRRHNGSLIGYARDQAEADAFKARYEQACREASPHVWAALRALWEGMTPEQHAYYNRPAETIERAA